MGIAATQIARNTGAEIFGTASRAKHEAIRAHGVRHAIDYRTEDFARGGGSPTVWSRRDHRPHGPDLVSEGLPDPASRWPTDHVRTVRSHGRARQKHWKAVSSLLRLPTATMPWWNGARLLNQNRGVFGLNLLSWWNRDGDIDRIIAPLISELMAGRLQPVVATSFHSRWGGASCRRATEHREGRPRYGWQYGCTDIIARTIGSAMTAVPL